MGGRQVIIKQSVVDGITEIAWYIESKGLISTANKFVDGIYDFFLILSDKKDRMLYAGNPEEPC